MTSGSELPRPTRIAILQPGYLPWLGYFEQMAAVDLFVSLDDVPYTKQDWRNRNRIRTNAPEGWSWLTVPVEADSTRGLIKDVRLRPAREWWPKHLRQLDEHYGRRGAIGYDPLRALLVDRLARGHEFLADLDLDLAAGLAQLLGVATPVARASALAEQIAAAELGLPRDKNAHLIAICLATGASVLYDGKSAAEFLDLGRFAAAGVTCEFQDYQHPEHAQCYPGFISHLSAIDAIACCGEDARAFCRQH